MNRAILFVAGLILSSAAIANQTIDTTAEHHEMILKLTEDISEKPLSELPSVIQNLELLPFAHSISDQSNRAKLFARMFRIDTENMTPQVILELSKKLEQLPDVEYCSLNPVYSFAERKSNRGFSSGTTRSTTPDYWEKQGYLKDTANGINAEYAWDLGIYGEEVTYREVEGAWDLEHEDLANIHVGLAAQSNEWMDHGTNTVGVLMAQHNGFGINGATPNATMYTYSVYNDEGGNSDPGRTFAVAKAIEEANPGDIVILELQDRGLDQITFPDYGPADVKMAIWDLVKAATSDSILVVAASGNGNQNLDGAPYEQYRNRGDNGGILVGSGKPEELSKTSSSGYGEMVRLQGWGYYVTTTGGGKVADWILQNDPHADYTSNYSGTSSATPVVTAAMGLVQSWAKQHLNRYLGPYEMRELLVSTGTPYTGDKHIGPLPNVKAAIEKLQETNETALGNTASTIAAFSLHSVSSDKIQLQIPTSGIYTVRLYSVNGRRIYSRSLPLCQGISVVPMNNMQSGMYILSVESRNFSGNVKCIVP